jgi:hypothetical protein
MKPYVPPTNKGRNKAEHDIHHETSDGGLSNRKAVAKSQRKAARQYSKKMLIKGE